MWEDRFKSAKEALNVFNNKSEIVYDDYSVVKSSYQKPIKSRVIMQKTSRSLIINIPSGSSTYIKLFVALFFVHFFALATFVSIGDNEFLIYIYLFNILTAFLTIWVQLSIKADIKIFKDEFLINWKILLFRRKIRGKVEDTAKLKKGIIFAYSVLSQR